MDIELYTQDEVVWVKLAGRLDIEGTEKVEDAFHLAMQDAWRGAVIDMEGVDFITSMGLRMLMTGASELRKRGGKMIILKPQWRVRESLEVSGLDRAMTLTEFPDEVPALLIG